MFLHGANASMATVHIIYVCPLMVVVVFHLMITPVTPAFLLRDPAAPICLVPGDTRCRLMGGARGSLWAGRGSTADNRTNRSCHLPAEDLKASYVKPCMLHRGRRDAFMLC